MCVCIEQLIFGTIQTFKSIHNRLGFEKLFQMKKYNGELGGLGVGYKLDNFGVCVCVERHSR